MESRRVFFVAHLLILRPLSLPSLFGNWSCFIHLVGGASVFAGKNHEG